MLMGVYVGVEVLTGVGAWVAVLVGVRVDVLVGVSVLVGVRVLVRVDATIFVASGVVVGPQAVSTVKHSNTIECMCSFRILLLYHFCRPARWNCHSPGFPCVTHDRPGACYVATADDRLHRACRRLVWPAFALSVNLCKRGAWDQPAGRRRTRGSLVRQNPHQLRRKRSKESLTISATSLSLSPFGDSSPYLPRS